MPIRNKYDYLDPYGDMSVDESGNDALASSLSGDTDPFADRPSTRYDMPAEDGTGGIGGTTEPAVNTGEPSSTSSSSPYSYGGDWLGFDANRFAGGSADSTKGNGKYYFTTVANQYDPNRIATDAGYRNELLNALNKNPYGLNYRLSSEGDYMVDTPGEGADYSYMGARLNDRSNPNSGYAWQWMADWTGQDPAQKGSNEALIQALSSNAPSTASAVTGTSNGVASSSGGSAGLDATLRDYLVRMMGKDPYAVDQNDPAISAAQTAYERAQERSLWKNREAMAERMNATGTMGGGFNSYVNDAYQNMGESNAQNAANLVLQQQSRQLDQLKQALSLGAGILTADQEAALRMQIAQMSDSLSRSQLAQQDQQFYDNLGYLLAALQINGNANAVNPWG